jgi:hypothetical protein
MNAMTNVQRTFGRWEWRCVHICISIIVFIQIGFFDFLFDSCALAYLSALLWLFFLCCFWSVGRSERPDSLFVRVPFVSCLLLLSPVLLDTAHTSHRYHAKFKKSRKRIVPEDGCYDVEVRGSGLHCKYFMGSFNVT